MNTQNNMILDTAGTPELWRDNVACLAVGNSRIAFAISCAFAAPLLTMVNEDGGGFNFYGASSTGKTISIYSAGSVWGSHKRKRIWPATSKELEMIAHQHNDSFLALDEICAVDPNEVGQMVYMLANGQAKQQANGINPKEWRLLFLSAGEVPFKKIIQEESGATTMGLELRLTDIEAAVGKHGVFDTLLDGFESSLEQAKHLHSMSNEYYGAVGLAFLERFNQSKEESLILFKASKADFVSSNIPEHANSQVKRVLNRFAVVAAGGELATHYGLTGWQPGESFIAAKACFENWLNNVGGRA